MGIKIKSLIILAVIIGIIFSLIFIHNYNKKQDEEISINLYKMMACENNYCSESPYAYFNESNNLCECFNFDETGLMVAVDSIIIQTEEEFNETSNQ